MKLICGIGILVLIIFCGSSEGATCNFVTIDNLYTCDITDGTGTTINEPEAGKTIQAVLATVPIVKDLVKVLVPMTGLTKLEIKNGVVDSYADTDFPTTCSLTSLQISNGKLTALTSSALARCTGLLNVDFSENTISTGINDLSFSGFTSTLKHLNLARNVLNTNLAANSFFVPAVATTLYLPALTSLNLSSNGITAFPSGFKLPSNILTTLDLSFNGFSTIDGTIYNTAAATLEELYLNNNALTLISDTQFSSLTKLTKLNIGGNQISSIVATAFSQNTLLLSLNISSSIITTLDRALFTPLTKLKTLDMHDIRITNSSLESLKAVLVSLTDLESLNISSNKIGSIDNLFNTNSKLIEIYLNDMELNSISENIFDSLTKLEAISMNSNSLTEFPANIFQKTTALKALHARNNNITQLKASTFEKLTKLEFLDLTGNKISGIQRGFFDKLESLKVIKLSGNSCFTQDILTLDRNNLTSFESCFNGYNSSATLIISNFLLLVVILLKFV